MYIVYLVNNQCRVAVSLWPHACVPVKEAKRTKVSCRWSILECWPSWAPFHPFTTCGLMTRPRRDPSGALQSAVCGSYTFFKTLVIIGG